MNRIDPDHLINVLTAIRKVTRIIISEKNADKLITRVCQSLVESREYLNAWILLVDNDGEYLNSAQAGIGEDFEILKQQLISGENTPCAIKTLNSRKLQSTSIDNITCNGCTLSNKCKSKCGLGVPILFKEQLYGVLTISLLGENVIEADESKLLSEVAQDLGFALHAIEVEQQKKEADLKVVEEQFLMSTLMDNLPDYVYFKNIDSEFIRVNKSMLKIFNATSLNEVVGKTDSDFFKNEHAEQALADEQTIMNTLKPIIDLEEKETWPDGRVTWVTTTKMPMIDSGGNVVGTFGISRDITKQKQTEESLRNSQEMFQKMGMGNLDSIIILNSTGRIEFWNPAAEKMFGYSSDFAKGKDVHDLIMPDKYGDMQRRGWSNFVKTGEGNAVGKVVELSAKKSSGEEFPVEMALSAMDFDGQYWALASIRDITERKKADKLLKERDELLLKVSENVPGMIFQFVLQPDGKSKFPYCSYGVQNIFGLNPEDIKEDSTEIFSYVHEDDFDALMETINISVQEQSIWQTQFRIEVGPENEEKWLKGEARPQLVENGNVEWYGYILDVTEQKKINDSLRLKNEQFELVVEGSNDGIWDLDLITNELYLSPQWKRQLGFADSEIDNNLENFRKLIHEDDRTNVFNNLAKYLDGNLETYDIEFRMYRKSGDFIWINAKGEAVRDENNKPIRMAGSHSDITERILSKKKLETEHERTRAIMNSVQSGIILVRKRDRVIVDANPAVEKILGISPDQYLNHICNKYICPSPAGQCPIIDLGKEMYNEECIVRNHKNELIPIIKNVSEIELDGELYFIESFVDISKQKETEKQLLSAKEKADLANKAKSEFLANMSHEIRTPMNSILGFSEVLLNKIKDEKYQGYLRTILSSGRTLLSLINDILDLSKIEAGRMDVEKHPVSLHEIVTEVAQLFEQKTKEKNINLIVEVEKNFPLSVELDEIRIRQVLLNIVGNAVKFTSQGFVKIGVSAKKKDKELLQLQIDISDSGIGISKDYLNNIFESFSQETSDSTRKFEGTGLGLAISKKLCELMNGKIVVESTLGKGSVFSISLNEVVYSNNEVHNDEEFSWDKQNILFHGAKILVVDDVEFNRDLIETYAEDLNLELIEAENGKLAVEMAKQIKPDLILMDIKMPIMGGYEATEILRSTSDTSAIPIIALTASTMQSEDQRIEKLFNGYLRKPVQRNPLIKELSKFLDHEVEEVEQADGQDNEVILLESASDIPTAVKQAFNEKFEKKLTEFENAMIIDEFERFTIELRQFAEENDIRFLKYKVEYLLKYIDEFEFNKIIVVLHELQNFFRVN